MIVYHPFEGNIASDPVKYTPKSCFVMTQLSGKNCPHIIRIRRVVSRLLKKFNIKEIDAASTITGGDYMSKIWKQTFSCPIGIAIISNDLPSRTIGNIFYELGLMDSYGKETLVIKTVDCDIPSDLNRTEYINAENRYSRKIESFLNNVKDRANYYEIIADNIEMADPVQAIDYMRRAYLITGDKRIKNNASQLFKARKSEIDKQSQFFIKDFLR